MTSIGDEEKECVCLNTWLSSPKNTIMMKKSAAHRVEKGIMLTARGYAMKARPGPTKIRMKKKIKKTVSCRSKMF